MALHKQISLYNTRTRFTLTDSRNSFVCMRLMKEQLKQSQSQPKPLGFTRKFNTTKPYISSLTGPPVDIWWVAFKKNLISIFPSSKSDCVSLLRGLQISTDFSGQGRLPDGMMNDPLRRTEMKSLCLIDWTFQHSEWLIARQCNGSLASVYWAFWTHYSPNEPMWRRNTVCFRIDNYLIVFFKQWNRMKRTVLTPRPLHLAEQSCTPKTLMFWHWRFKHIWSRKRHEKSTVWAQKQCQ